MSNSLTAYLGNNQLADIDDADLVKDIATARDSMDATTTSDLNFLYFSGKHGTWTYGKDRRDVSPEDLWMLEPSLLFHGWTCWKDSQVVERIEWSIRLPDNAVDADDLQDHGPYRPNSGDGWAEAAGAIMMLLDGKETAKFSLTSVSGRNAMNDLWGEIHKRGAVGEPMRPVMVLAAQEFQAQGSWNYKPIFDVQAWVSKAAAVAYVQDEISIEQLLDGDEPKKARAAKKTTKKRGGRRAA